MTMKKSCEFCEVLNIADLLEDSKDIDPRLAERLMRYYCKNPDSDNDYCPYCGEKEKCIYQKMQSFNQKVLK